jgi:phosphoribosylanthranilate isomerase
MIRVKVCGMTRASDAELAAELGASAVGVVGWGESPRAVSISRAQEIARALPPFVGVVGVFVNAPVDQVRRWCDAVPLVAVQLHGDEPLSDLGSFTRPVIKAVFPTVETADGLLDAWPKQVTLLVDAGDPVRRGGTGRLADWSLAARLAQRRRVLLAGGLSAGNVADAIRQVRPWGVDVASGVESSPGVKDPVRLRAFLAAVRAVGAERGHGTG